MTGAARGQVDGGRDEPISIRLQDATMEFSGVRALSGLSLELSSKDRQTCVGLLGTNGSGKSTLANVLCGFYNLTAGSAYLGETEISSALPAECTKLGVRRSFQDVSKIVGLTLLEYVCLGWEPDWKTSLVGAVFGSPRARREERAVREEAAAALEDVGLGPFASRRLEDCPYGVRKLGDLTRVLAGNGGVLAVLDEPTSGISQAEKNTVASVILAAVRSRIFGIMLVIDHDVRFIRDVCSEVVVLESGLLIAQGPAAEVLDRPRVRESFAGVSSTERNPTVPTL